MNVPENFGQYYAMVIGEESPAGAVSYHGLEGYSRKELETWVGVAVKEALAQGMMLQIGETQFCAWPEKVVDMLASEIEGSS